MSDARADEVTGLLAALREHDGSALGRAHVLETLLDSEVLIPLGATSTESEPARVASVIAPDGRTVLAVFTGPASLARWANQDIGFGLTTGQEAARIARDREHEGLVIDPGDPDAIALSPDEVAALAEGVVPQADGTGLVVGDRIVSSPRQPVSDELQRVAQEVAEHAVVEAVYVFEARYGDAVAQPSLVLGVRMTPGSLDQLNEFMSNTAERLSTVLPQDAQVDLVAVDDTLAAELNRLVEPVQRAGRQPT